MFLKYENSLPGFVFHKKRKMVKTKTQVGDAYLASHWLEWLQREVFTDLMPARMAMHKFDTAGGEKNVHFGCFCNFPT